MSDVDINDIRSSKEFKGITFSKFQKTKVKSEIISCLSSGKVESACYWTGELICAGQFFDVWETIILYIDFIWSFNCLIMCLYHSVSPVYLNPL